MLHLRPHKELLTARVSQYSRWTDKRWVFQHTLPGKKRHRILFNWDIDIGRGRLLTDPEFSRLLDVSKRLLWSLRIDRRNGKNLGFETVYTAYLGLKRLIPWMVDNKYNAFDELTVESSDEYVIDLAKEAADAEVDLSTDRVFNKDDYIRALRIWVHLHQQGPALQGAGVAIFKEPPFNGRSTYDLAGELAEDTSLRIPPLPDEIAMPILAAAIRMVRYAASDIIRVQDELLSVRAQAAADGLSISGRTSRQTAVLLNAKFSTVPGEKTPWHSPLVEGSIVRRSSGKPITKLGVAGTFRDLIGTIRDAAVIVTQGLVGVRINEVCSFAGGWNEITNLPKCVEVERTLDDLEDLYYVRGVLTKGRSAPEPARWLLGSRPANGGPIALDKLPLPVIALSALEKLYSPWRELGDVSELIVNFTSAPRAVPVSKDGVGSPSSETLAAGMKNFVMNHVDLTSIPDTNWRGEGLAIYRDSLGSIIRTHQWRKTFAHYVLLTRGNLLHAVSQHFKHLSLAMTEQGYVIDDPFLRGMLGEAAIEASADFFHQASLGEPITGKLGDLIGEHRSELIEVSHNSVGEHPEQRFRNYVLTHDLRIFHMSEGRCGLRINPLAARCHQIAGTTSWANREPNYATREPSVCLGCNCFGIDRDTAPYWRARFEINSQIYADAVQNGVGAEYRIAASRADQASKVIKAFGLTNLEGSTQ